MCFFTLVFFLWYIYHLLKMPTQIMLIMLTRIPVKLKTNKRYHYDASSYCSVALLDSCCTCRSSFRRALLCAVCTTLIEYALILCFSCHVLHNSFKAGYPVVSGAAVLITGSVSPLGGKLRTTQHPLLILLGLLDR